MRSPGCPSVHHDFSAGQNGRVIRSQVQNRFGHFIGLAESAQGNGLANPLLQRPLCLFRGQDQGPDRGSRGARGHLVDPDLAWRELRSQISGHGAYPAFGGRVGREARDPEHGLNRTIQDDLGAFLQVRRRGLDGEENAR